MKCLEAHSKFCSVSKFYEESLVLIDSDMENWLTQIGELLKYHVSKPCNMVHSSARKQRRPSFVQRSGLRDCSVEFSLRTLQELVTSALDCSIYSVLTFAHLSQLQQRLVQLCSAIYTHKLHRSTTSRYIRKWIIGLQRALAITIQVVRGYHKCSFQLASMRIASSTATLPVYDALYYISTA